MDIKTPTKEERIAFHIRGIKLVLMAAVLGILAGILSSPLFLSQPIAVPLSQSGPSILQAHPSFMLTNVSTVEVNSSDLLTNVSAVNMSAFTLMNRSSPTHTNNIIQLDSASIKSINGTILAGGVNVSPTTATAAESGTPLLLTTGLLLKPNASLGQTASPSLLLTNATILQINPQAPDHSSFAFLILAIAIYIQKFLFPLVKVNSAEFTFKDWFFISFIAFCFWYVAWTILINPIGVPLGQIYHYPFGPFF
ncbi:MAG TPA: hypothetical protein VK436_12540 [Methanocella sp.]|nr:hypothetical protein [Methanocella sp.]